jgi:hypothetical protein
MTNARRFTTVLATVGVLVGGLLLASVPAFAASEQWAVVGTFGSAPADPQPLSDPTWVAVEESTGDVYVTDKGNNRVEYFSATGSYLGQFTGSATPAGSFASPGPIAIDNSCSQRDLSEPTCKAEDPSDGDVYIIDSGHDVIDKFAPSGAYLGQITAGVKGVAFYSGELKGVAVDTDGELWVAQAVEFNPQSGGSGVEFDEFSDAAENALTSVRKGSEYYEAPGLAVDAEGNSYIDSAAYYGVQEYNSTGELIVRGAGGTEGQGTTGLALDEASNELYTDLGAGIVAANPLLPGSSEHFGGGLLSDGGGVAIDEASGDVYVAEAAGGSVFFFEHSSISQVPPASPKTDSASEVTGTSVKLTGELNPEGILGGVGYYFSYNFGAGATCTGPGSKKTLFDDGASNATGNTEVSVSAAVTGLEPQEDYVFCLVADKFGTTEGQPGTFSTPGAPPTIISASASNRTQESGELHAVINPENEATTYFFEYATTAAAIGTPSATETEGEAPLPAEFGEPTVTVPAGFTQYRGTYYYRVVATNGTGTSYGKLDAYTKLPVIASESYSGLTSTTAKLEAEINPSFQNTTYAFEYATSEAALAKGEGEQVLGGSGTLPENEEPISPIPVSVEVSLQPGQTYYFRVVAENASSENAGNINAGKPVEGAILSFTPYAPPAVTTGETQAITRTTAAFSGEVNPEGAQTTYYFAYISQAGYEKAIRGDAQERANPYAEGEVTAANVLAAGNRAEAIGPIPVGGLLPGETYDYALVAENVYAIRTIGPDRTFTAAAASLPIISTGVASGVSQNAATLSATVSTNGLQTSYGFEIGTEAGRYGPATGLGDIGGAATEEVRVTLSELQPGTTYYYRVTATNADGTVQGQPESFATPAFPTLISPPASAPLVAALTIAFPTEEATSTTTTIRKVTNAQKLAKALKACRKDKQHSKRAKCEASARQRYGAKRKKKS